ncbi:MAG TPA: amidohydrolase family protein, partial [Rhodoglobus sp.]|nr:amidohydrolase family protein [Rhodoglobus sp.]
MILGNARLGDAVVDLRIEDGTIAEIGDIGSPDIDASGRWVIPGLWDEHVHYTQWALTSQRIDLGQAVSAQHAADIVGTAVVEGADLLVGANFRDALWPDAPTAALLDAVTGGIPTALVSADLHAVWLNTAGLARFGHAGHPTGLLVEDDAFGVEQQLGTVPAETIDAWGRAAAAAAARRGVVGVADLEMAWNLGDWQRRVDAGHDALRVEFAIYTEHLDRAIGLGLRTGSAVGELLSVGRYKVLTDGSLNTRTAYLHDAYGDGTHGMLVVPFDTLVQNMRKATAAGIEPTVHAIGDHANTLALDAFEAVGSGGRMEHAQLLTERDVPRFAALGVEVSAQPQHLVDDRDVADHHWAGRTGRAYPFRSLLDAGATLRFGSDAPVSPLDPWVGIAAAVDRTQDERPPWHGEQRITNAEALAASTRTIVAVGQPADLAIVEYD